MQEGGYKMAENVKSTLILTIRFSNLRFVI